jgi:hypothetical protein
MNMRRLSLIFLPLLISAISCISEDDATVVSIFANPSSYIVGSGDKIYLDLEVSTLNNILTDVTVSTFDSEYGTTEILDTKPETKKFKDRIVWEIPSMTNDTTSVEITIAATDDQDVSNKMTLKIKVTGGGFVLTPERSGYSIYSPKSGKADAFSFRTLQPLKKSSESEDCDIIFIDSEENDAMPRQWGTGTDIVFCKANNFDYASASKASISAIFNNSIRFDSVDNLQPDDIILIGRDTKIEGTTNLNPLGVIKIIAIYDEDGTNNDRMIFNLKAL